MACLGRDGSIGVDLPKHIGGNTNFLEGQTQIFCGKGGKNWSKHGCFSILWGAYGLDQSCWMKLFDNECDFVNISPVLLYLHVFRLW